VACLHRHVNGHTDAAFHLNPDTRPHRLMGVAYAVSYFATVLPVPVLTLAAGVCAIPGRLPAGAAAAE